MAAQPLSPGDMTEVVALFRPTLVEDEFGQHPGWAIAGSTWAKVEPLRGRDFFAAGATQNVASLRVSMYWRPGILGTWRLGWMGVLYELVADPIDVDARHQALELMCAGVPGVPLPSEPLGSLYLDTRRVLSGDRYVSESEAQA